MADNPAANPRENGNTTGKNTITEDGLHSNEILDQKRDELIFELIKRRFDYEFTRTNNLDGKAHNSVGYVGAIVALLLGTGSLLTGAEAFKYPIQHSSPTLIIYFVGIATLLISIGLALGALKVRKWAMAPDVEVLIKKYTVLPYSEVLKRNAGEMAKVVNDTKTLNHYKAKLIDISWYFLISGLLIVLISASISHISGSNM
jgi:hypothetical protein